MKREEAKTNLIALGIEEPTKEQIDSYLNSFQGDLQKEKDKADLLKDKADKFDQSQAELEAERTKNLTAEEKLQASIEANNLEKIGYTKATNKLAVEKILLAAGLTEADYSELIDGLVTDNAETSTKLATGLATMLTNRTTATEAKVKEQLLNGNPVPPGGGGAIPPAVKTEAEQIASNLAKSSVSQESTNAIIANYQ